jgi:phage terminase large subunit
VPTFTHTFAPRGGAQRLFASREGEVLLAGSAGTGKSRACLEKVHFMMMLTPGSRGLIVRKTAISLASSALVTWERDVVDCALRDGTLSFFGGSPREPAQYRYSNGSVVVVGGMDKADKIMSTEYDVIYAQEATELTVDDWEKATSRLRNGVMRFQQLLADCNPSHPTHFLKQRAERGDLVMLESRHEDNPKYVNADGSYTEQGQAYIVGVLDKLTGVRKLRLRDGLWAAADGVIWEDFDPVTHVVDRLPEGSEYWNRYWAIDFGFTNPFVLQCWAEDPDGRLYLYREIYHTGLLAEDAAKEILDIVAPFDRWGQRTWIEPKPQAIVTDHDAEDRATFERHVGMGTTAAKKDVSPGLQAVATRMRRAADGKPRLFLVKNSVVRLDSSLIERRLPTSTIAEIPGYIWDAGKEKPRKVNDHGCDTTRYIVMYLDGQAEINFRRL